MGFLFKLERKGSLKQHLKTMFRVMDKSKNALMRGVLTNFCEFIFIVPNP